MKRFEVNLDGLVGPTHNYAGLGFGNLASAKNRGLVSNPRVAALQGLEKMRRLHDLGLKQIVMPSAPRPHLGFLRQLGFSGSDAAVVEKAGKADPRLLSVAFSASSMWTANAATVCPSVDAPDGKVHFTPANLASQPHRSLEVTTTASDLQTIFASPKHFIHHDPVPVVFGDEGAANHTRFSGSDLGTGVHLFVYGSNELNSRKYHPRQSEQTSKAIARMQGIEDVAVFATQSVAAVDAGVFHNDVISVGHENFFLMHEQGFASPQSMLRALRRAFRIRCGKELRVFIVKASELSLREAVTTYLFNSQIVTLPGGGFLLLAAEECRQNARTRKILAKLLEKDFVSQVEFVDLRQSMRNGGGPACLRLRVELSGEEWQSVSPGFKFNGALEAKIRKWIGSHYRDRLSAKDLRDPELFRECRKTQSGLRKIFGISAL